MGSCLFFKYCSQTFNRERSAGWQPVLELRKSSLVPNGGIIGWVKPVGDRRSSGKRRAPHPSTIPGSWKEFPEYRIRALSP